jgi:hypothetical protein
MSTLDSVCPDKYWNYLRVDKLANGVFADVETKEELEELKKWVKTVGVKNGFQEDGKRSAPGKKLSKEVYDMFGKYYNIPDDLIDYLIIGGIKKDLCFSSLMPENKKSSADRILSNLKSKLSERKIESIIKWMAECRKAKKVLPLKALTILL